MSDEAIGYLTVDEAGVLAATVVGLAAWSAADDAAKGAALAQASSDVDAAMPYQGRPVDLDATAQFPRIAYQGAPDAAPVARASGADVVWDWDAVTNAPAVPRAVKLAVLYQADAIL